MLMEIQSAGEGGSTDRRLFIECLEASYPRFVNASSKGLPSPLHPSHSSFVCLIVPQIGVRTHLFQPFAKGSEAEQERAGGLMAATFPPQRLQAVPGPDEGGLDHTLRRESDLGR